MKRSLLCFVCFAGVCAGTSDILVTGALGRTGNIIYKSLKERGSSVRAFDLSVDKTAWQQATGCDACDASEGIYTGDVRDPASLVAPFAGVGSVVIAVATGGANRTEELMRDVEYQGVINQVAALTNATTNDAARTLAELRVVLISSMATTNPNPAPYEGGPVLFWKLNAEAFLGSAASLKLRTTAIKPCGLGDGKPGAAQLLATPATDALFATCVPPMINRADVARVSIAALDAKAEALPQRFDLCSRATGTPTPDSELDALLKGAQWPWMA